LKQNHEPANSDSTRPKSHKKKSKTVKILAMSNPPPNESGPNKPQQKCFSWGEIIQGLIWLSASAAAGFTLYLAIIANDAEHRQLRAYVFTENAGIELSTDEKQFAVHLTIKNFGQTPAYQFSTWLKYDIKPRTALPYDGPDLRTGEDVLGPSGKINIDDTRAFPPGDLQLIRAGNKAFFAWGGADYTDAFGIRRSIYCRFISAPNEGADIIDGRPWHGWALQPHGEGCQETKK